VSHEFPSVPDFTTWPTFPFDGDIRVRRLDPPVAEEPPRQGEDPETCTACRTPDSEYVWVADRWRVRGLDRPSGLPMVLILESRSHLDLGDLPNLLAAELGVMTVRLERAIRSLDGIARVHVNRWGDGSAHLHLWFLARPYGRLQLRGTFLSLWDDILPPTDEAVWRANLGLIGAWLAEFGGRSMVAPPRIDWQTPSGLGAQVEDDSAARPVVAHLATDRFEPVARKGDKDTDAKASGPAPEPAPLNGSTPTVGGDGGPTARIVPMDPGDPEQARRPDA